MHLSENGVSTVLQQNILILDFKGEGHNIFGSYGSNPRRRDPLSLGKLSLLHTRVQLEKPVFSPTKKLHPHNLQKLSNERYTYFSLGLFDDIPNGFDVALWT